MEEEDDDGESAINDKIIIDTKTITINKRNLSKLIEPNFYVPNLQSIITVAF